MNTAPTVLRPAGGPPTGQSRDHFEAPADGELPEAAPLGHQNATDGRWTPKTARRRADLAQGDLGLHGVQEPWHQVVGPAGRPLDGIEGARRPSPSRRAAEIPVAPPAAFAHRGSSWNSSAGRRLLDDELVDAHDDPRPGLDLLLVAVRRVLDLPLHEGDRLHRAAEPVDLVDVGLRPVLDVAGEALHHVGPAQRVDGRRHPRLVREDLLGPERDAHRRLGGQGQRLVHRVGVQRLAAAQNGGQRLHGDAHDVVLRLLRGQRAARRLGVEPEHQRARIPGPEPLPHEARPQPARGAELRDLLEEIVVGVEEERELRRELVDLEPGVQRRLHVGDAVGQREGHLLHRGPARLAHVVARDGDRVPAGHALPAIAEDVRDEPERRRRAGRCRCRARCTP